MFSVDLLKALIKRKLKTPVHQHHMRTDFYPGRHKRSQLTSADHERWARSASLAQHLTAVNRHLTAVVPITLTTFGIQVASLQRILIRILHVSLYSICFFFLSFYCNVVEHRLQSSPCLWNGGSARLHKQLSRLRA